MISSRMKKSWLIDWFNTKIILFSELLSFLSITSINRIKSIHYQINSCKNSTTIHYQKNSLLRELTVSFTE